MNASASCPGDCPCGQYQRDEEVVPYREATDGPTDELLLSQWAHHRCGQCLTWWLMRVYEDHRYRAIVATVGKDYPRADIESCVNEVLHTIWSQHDEVRRPRGYFKLLLKQRAQRDSGSKRAAQVYVIDPLDQSDVYERAEAEIDAGDERLDRLNGCLEKLESRARRLVEAFYNEQRSIGMIAIDLSLSYDACARRLSRVRKRLVACVEASVASLGEVVR